MRAALLAMGLAASVWGVSGCAHRGPASGRTSEQAATTNMQLAIEYMKLGKMSTSRDYAERALSQAPTNANVQFTAALIYERLGDMQKAERAYSAAARLGRQDPNIQGNYAGFLCRTGKAAEGEKIFGEVAQSPLYTTPEVAWVNAGVCVHSTGNAVDAERYFLRALAIRPNMPEALLQSANLAFERGDSAQAMSEVQRYLAANPATPEILWLGFRAEAKRGNSGAAAGYARRVQTEFPNSEQAQRMRLGTDP